ncbi:MAG TPA: Ig-like domain-containing protein, partial [Verrucomicrobiae bacterium]|nr:Ig-like domain-containing protein [Verrucomicrobiae bacterium]
EESSYLYNWNAFLAKLGSDGTVLYSTFRGRDEWISSITFRNDGTMFVDRRVSPVFISQLQFVYSSGSDHPFEPELPPVSYESREFLTLVSPYTGQAVAEALLPMAGYGYNMVRGLVVDSRGDAHFCGATGPGDYLAQFDTAHGTFPRFAIMDDCTYTGLGGPAITAAGELWIARFTFDTNFMATDGALLKLTPVLASPTNRAPIVTLNGYGIGLNASPGLAFEPEPPRIDPMAADTDGNVRQVELFAGSTLLAVLTNSPYSFAWSNAPYGEHILRAVATDNLGLSSTSCPASITVPAPPANDSFYRSTIVTGTAFTVSGTTAGATRDVGEPDSPSYYSYSVWWCWRAPVEGTFSLRFVEGADSHTVNVFTGKDLNELTSLGGGATVAFQAVAGKAYYIRVNGYGRNEYTLALDPAVPPPNDNFANRVAISGVPLSLQGNNINATFEPGLNVASGDDFASVWWAWTAPTGGLYRVTTIATNPYSAWLRVVSTQTSDIFLPPPYPGGGSTNVVLRGTAGEEFYIRVSGPEMPFELQIDPVATPANDNVVDAISIFGFPVSISGSLVGATRETGEPIHATYGSSSSSVWYKWTPPSNASVVVEVNSDNNGGLVAIYSRQAGYFMIETRSPGNDWPAQLQVVSGSEYWIAVDSTYAGTGDFTLTIRPRRFPPNDNFAQRTLVTVSGYGSNAEATFEPIDDAGLRAYDETETIWYSWFAPADGDYTLVTHSAGFSGRAVVFKLGESGNLVPVGGGINMKSRFVQFTASAGTEYPIAFISRQNEGGGLAFNIRPSNAPLNDDFGGAALLAGANLYVEASNVDATTDEGDSLSASVWWKWTPPQSGLYVVSLARSGISARIEVSRGSGISNRVQVLPIYSLEGSVLVNVTAGEEYHIAVYGMANVFGWREQQGNFTLAITSIDRPPNDDFANATVIPTPAAVPGTTLGATAEEGETAPSVWWRWTAPAAQLTTVQITLDRPLEVFVGSSLGTLTPVANSSGPYRPSSLAFEAQAGVTYHIRVRQYAFAPFTLTVKGPATLEQPTISAAAHAENGAIQFAIDALIGTTNIIESSPDLQNWSLIATNLTDCFPYTFTAPASAQWQQFYRVRLVR